MTRLPPTAKALSPAVRVSCVPCKRASSSAVPSAAAPPTRSALAPICAALLPFTSAPPGRSVDGLASDAATRAAIPHPPASSSTR